MTTFAESIRNQSARTANGMQAHLNTSHPCVDLFYTIGAARNMDTIIPAFLSAYERDLEVAVRIALYARDVRGGMGERKVFRDILHWLEAMDTLIAKRVMHMIPELGRWDDLLFPYQNAETRDYAFSLIRAALHNGNGLCAKWMPRKGAIAHSLRHFLGLTPKQYRKKLVALTSVVETQMCANKWDEIVYSHVPSVAHSIYRKAFARHSIKYQEYLDKVTSGEEKINAGAIFPHDILKGVHHIQARSQQEKQAIVAQWDALPNHVGDAKVLPLVDVSGSMLSSVGGTSTTCMDVAVSLGLYMADKNEGAFKDCILTFSSTPQLLHLTGDIVRKCEKLVRSEWGMSTNLHRAFEQILNTATDNNVPQEEMPNTLLIFSDMQFNQCVRYDDRALQMIERQYEASGYTIPQVVFWNINSHNNAPVKFNQDGVALLSGFSPASVKGVLEMDTDSIDPYKAMIKLIGVDRYDF